MQDMFQPLSSTRKGRRPRQKTRSSTTKDSKEHRGRCRDQESKPTREHWRKSKNQSQNLNTEDTEQLRGMRRVECDDQNSSRIRLNLIVSNIEDRQGTQRTQQRSGKQTYHGSTETRRTAVRLAHPSYCICRMMSSPYQQHDCDSRIHQHKCCRIQPGRQ